MDVMNIRIVPNEDRKICGINHCRPCVAKNFQMYDESVLFELDKLCFGVMVKQCENDKYVLYKSTCHPMDDYSLWCIQSKKTGKICLELETCINDGATFKFDDDAIILHVNEVGVHDWGIGTYEYDNYSLYHIRRIYGPMNIAKSITVVEDNTYMSLYDKRHLYIHLDPKLYRYSIPVMCKLF